MKFIGGIMKVLPVASDITLDSFDEMVKLLNEEPPLLLGGSREQITAEVSALIMEYSPITAIVIIPEPILNHPRSWFLAGTTIVAISHWINK